MNDQLEKVLQSVDVPDVHLPAHQRALRTSLLAQYTKKKGGEVPFMKRKVVRFSAIGFLSVVLIAIVTVTTLLPKTPQAQAQEIVSNAMDHIITLSDADRKVLEEKIKADLEGSLEEAKQAKDLTVVPEEEIQRIDPPKEFEKKDVLITKPFKIDGPDGHVNVGDEMKPGTRIEFSGKVMAPHGVKVLRYTNPEGKKIILGINDKNEPVMKLMFLDKKDVHGLPGRDTIRFEHAL